MPSHRLVHPEVVKRLAAAPVAPQWPSFTGVSQFVGTTADGRCTVWYDPSLGAAGLQNATDLLADAPRVMVANDALFGVAGGPVSVIVFALGGATDGTGGADHMGCDFNTGQNIEVCASFGQSARVSALFEAELSECSMNNQLCGLSTGEALSRWTAIVVGNNALADFATAPQWAADGMPNFVDTVDPTDQNADSTGCGMAFISWLLTLAPSHTLAQIAQAMVALGDSGTLADLYAKLYPGQPATSAWPLFSADINKVAVTSDDPFSAMGAPTPAPGPTGPTGATGSTGPTGATGPSPSPTPVSGLMWASLATDALLAGVATGETADELKADINSIPT